MAKVIKDFKTTNRRFAAGDDISPSDISGHVLSWDDLKAAGIIEQETPAESSGDSTVAVTH